MTDPEKAKIIRGYRAEYRRRTRAIDNGNGQPAWIVPANRITRTNNPAVSAHFGTAPRKWVRRSTFRDAVNDISQRPALSDPMAAPVVAAIDQQPTNAGSLPSPKLTKEILG
jgi:hypothetical protein